MGLHMAIPGAEIVGVDLAPQPRYPFRLEQADALSVPFLRADFVWASPPCQAYTRARKLQGRKHPELIERTRELLRASGKPYVIENVEGAPLENAIMLCGAMFGLRTYRHRFFECSFPVRQPEHPKHIAKTTKMGRPPREGEFMHVVGHFSGVRQAQAAMEIRWMGQNELREAIPPAYSYYIAKEFLKWKARKTA